MDIIENYLKNQVEEKRNKEFYKTPHDLLLKKHLLWHIIHYLTFIYPDNPSEEEKNIFSNFFVLHLQNTLSCKPCQEKYNKQINEINLDFLFSSKKNLFNFFVDLHNEISTKKNRIGGVIHETYNYEEIEEFYKKYDFGEYFKIKYNLDIEFLIKNKLYEELIEKYKKLN